MVPFAVELLLQEHGKDGLVLCNPFFWLLLVNAAHGAPADLVPVRNLGCKTGWHASGGCDVRFIRLGGVEGLRILVRI